MNLLACSTHWNILPRSTPHFCSSETWSVCLPSCSKGDGAGRKLRTDARIVSRSDKRPHEDVKRMHTYQLTRNTHASHCLMWSYSKQQHQCVICAIQKVGMLRKLATFHNKMSRKDQSAVQFQTIWRDMIKALCIKVTSLTTKTACFFFKTKWWQPFDWCGNYFWRC